MGISCYNIISEEKIIGKMRVIAKGPLRAFWRIHPDAEGALKAWHAEVEEAKWRTPPDVKAHYRSASILPGGRVVFNIGGNKYRLVAKINYAYKIVYVRFIGTHKEYDRIDAGEI
jgi:mRNA interferase HigB